MHFSLMNKTPVVQCYTQSSFIWSYRTFRGINVVILIIKQQHHHQPCISFMLRTVELAQISSNPPPRPGDGDKSSGVTGGGPPRVTPSRGDTRPKLIVCG